MSGILCLKWNNHTSTFIKTLDHLRSKELYCDATIACHGKYYPVHRFVLTTCSEYFEEIFERIQCKHPFIIVKDVEEPQLEALLNYMYKGEVNVLQERLPGLIRAAEALKVKGLAVPEDDIEEKKPPKEKRKSNLSSSPLEPKSKRKTDRSHSERSLHDSVEEDDDDDDITEVVNQSSNSPRKSTERKSSKDGSTHFRHKNLGNMESTYQHSSAGRDKLAETEVDDIKIEPNEIFETVDEEFPSNSAAESEEAMEAMEASRREESLFVSLLSPNNTHPASDEEMMTGNEASNQAIPQCSSWSDDVSTNSDKVHDEMFIIDDIKVEEQDVFSEPPTPLMYEELPPDDTSSSNPTKKTFQCSLCPYKTNYRTNLKTHIARRHTGELPFSCSFCKYKTTTKESLKIHSRKHTGEKPYQCRLCPYKAAHYNSIKMHRYIHIRDKPFSCTKCPYSAAQKKALLNHMRRHVYE